MRVRRIGLAPWLIAVATLGVGVWLVSANMSAGQPLPGDVNCDRSANSIDATLTLQFSAGLISTLPCQDAADVNRSGTIDARDATLILQYVAGLLAELPQTSAPTSLPPTDLPTSPTATDAPTPLPSAGTPTALPPTDTPLTLVDVRFWAYQIQGLEEPGAIEAIVASHYDLVVIEPTRTLVGSESFDTAGVVSRIQSSPNSSGAGTKLVLAYLDIGEAEDYRTYWEEGWVAPTDNSPGDPDFLITVDPDGWSGNYPVAYWDSRWKDIVIHRAGSLIDLAIADGFDGIYLDWVEAFDDQRVIEAAEQAQVNAGDEMVAFIGEMRAFAEARHPGFLIVAQNGADLLDDRPEYLGIIDGLAQEDLSFLGEADTEWEDPESGDIPQDAAYHAYLMGVLARYSQAGEPLFCVQYAQEPGNVQIALQDAEELGCVPYVTLTPLDRLTDTPPPGY